MDRENHTGRGRGTKEKGPGSRRGVQQAETRRGAELGGGREGQGVQLSRVSDSRASATAPSPKGHRGGAGSRRAQARCRAGPLSCPQPPLLPGHAASCPADPPRGHLLASPSPERSRTVHAPERRRCSLSLRSGSMPPLVSVPAPTHPRPRRAAPSPRSLAPPAAHLAARPPRDAPAFITCFSRAVFREARPQPFPSLASQLDTEARARTTRRTRRRPAAGSCLRLVRPAPWLPRRAARPGLALGSVLPPAWNFLTVAKGPPPPVFPGAEPCRVRGRPRGAAAWARALGAVSSRSLERSPRCLRGVVASSASSLSAAPNAQRAVFRANTEI